MASIRSRADELVKENHPKPEQVMKCSDLVFTRWQQLMKKANEKQQVVMSSYNFFKTSEQVRRFALCSILFLVLSKSLNIFQVRI